MGIFRLRPKVINRLYWLLLMGWLGIAACSTDSEDEQILMAAGAYARTHSDISVEMEVAEIAGDYARVQVMPTEPGAADEAVLFLKKKNGTWEGIVLGSGFTPEDYQQLGIPENIRE